MVSSCELHASIYRSTSLLMLKMDVVLASSVHPPRQGGGILASLHASRLYLDEADVDGVPNERHTYVLPASSTPQSSAALG